MMDNNDLISRAAALDAIDCWHIDFNTMDGAKVQTDCWRAIKELPAVDAVPVVHGRWEEVEGVWDDVHYRCSVCGNEWYLEDGTPSENGMNYCTSCGAKMDGDANG